MKHIILGTAGHIDHGKTTFIKALTGTDCDRLKEEKERGITIELGYAAMTLPSGVKVGIVDVPGHERFVSKMVAGAAGIDVVAFIISAEEGIKPQTREHLFICNLLGVKRGIVVVTKKDLVDAELLELQIEEIHDFLKGSVLDGVPVVPVSSVTGEGIAEFTAALDAIAREVTTKPVDVPFRMPVDDIVVIKGFGTVVRGTAITGTVAVGDEMALEPGIGTSRVRSIQSHGEKIETGQAGERLALNLPDIKRDDLERGIVVVKDGYFIPTRRLLVELSYLPYNEKPMKARVKCQFHILTARVNAELLLLGVDSLEPGGRCFALARLDEPVIACWGDPFVIRGYGIYTTQGGGRIVGPAVRTMARAHYTQDYLDTAAAGDTAALAALFVKERRYEGLSVPVLVGMLSRPEEPVRRAVQGLASKGVLVADEKGVLFHRDTIDEVQSQVSSLVAAFHRDNPLKPGAGKGELAKQNAPWAHLAPLAITRLAAAGKLVVDGDIVRDAARIVADSATGKLYDQVATALAKGGITPPDPSEIAKQLAMDERKLKDVLAALAKAGRAVKVKDDYWLAPDALERAKEGIAGIYAAKKTITPADVRDTLGITRKHIIPLLEYLDSVKFTIRTADARVLRR